MFLLLDNYVRNSLQKYSAEVEAYCCYFAPKAKAKASPPPSPSMEKHIVRAVALEQLEINPMPLTKGFQILPSLSLTKHRFYIIQMGFLKIELISPSFYIFSLIFTYFP